MARSWRDEGSARCAAPVSLIVSAFAPVTDVRGALLTPQLRTDGGDTVLLLIDLGRGQEPPGWLGAGPGVRPAGRRDPRSGRPSRAEILSTASALRSAEAPARVSRPLRRRPVGHRVRDDVRRATAASGGVPSTAARMASIRRAASSSSVARQGPALARCSPRSSAPWSRCAPRARDEVTARFARAGLTAALRSVIGSQQRARPHRATAVPVFAVQAHHLRASGRETTFRMQSLRDDPDCAPRSTTGIDAGDPGVVWPT